MHMNKNRKARLGLLAFAIVILVVFYLPKFFEQSIPEICIEDGTCEHEEYAKSIITYLPLILLLGFFFGVLLSFFYFEKKVDLPVNLENKNKSLLSMFNPSERKVISKIIENGGKALQSEISRIEGIGKVKAHRVIDRLVRRGVLEKEELGKTNMLKLRKDLFGLFN